MVTIAGAIIGAVITCALSLVGSYIMIRYQLNKQRKYEIVNKFLDEANSLYANFERIIILSKDGMENSPEGVSLQKTMMDKAFHMRSLVFLIKDNRHISKEGKEVAEKIYFEFANIVNEKYVGHHLVNIRGLLEKFYP